MAKIDFAFGVADRLRAACIMIRSRYQAGHTLTIWCRDTAQLAYFDRLLWDFDVSAFLPHVYASDPLATVTPIILTHELENCPSTHWLVNLDTACPLTLQPSLRVLEIVSRDEGDIRAARLRWKYYKNAGHELVAHDLMKNKR